MSPRYIYFCLSNSCLVNRSGCPSTLLYIIIFISFSVRGSNWKEGEQAEETTEYTLAKILGRANEVNKFAREFDFKAEYKIDFGTKTEYRTVSVLDIYSYHQDDIGNFVSVSDETEVDVPLEKNNITRALNLAKKLEYVTDRRKVLKRLFLHWVHCKDSKIAEEMTTFIESEVAKLKVLRVEETQFRDWRNRGRRERTIFRSYTHWMSGGEYCGSSDGSHHHSSNNSSYGSSYSSDGCVYSFDRASEYVEPNTDEAERWVKQSKADLDVAKVLLNKSFSQVCHLGQQCVEKVLKGVLYAKCGIPRRELRTHDIYRLASKVRLLDRVPDEIDCAGKVANYYLPTRYPDNQPKYKVPAEEYNEDQAKEALEVAEKVYTALAKFADDIDD